jgi:hypothetical protein
MTPQPSEKGSFDDDLLQDLCPPPCHTPPMHTEVFSLSSSSTFQAIETSEEMGCLDEYWRITLTAATGEGKTKFPEIYLRIFGWIVMGNKAEGLELM